MAARPFGRAVVGDSTEIGMPMMLRTKYNKHRSANPLRNAKPKLTLPGSFVRDIIH